MAASRQEAEKLFKSLDKDKDGILKRGDILEYAGGDESMVAEIMDLMDPSKTGKISLATFIEKFPSLMDTGSDPEDDDDAGGKPKAKSGGPAKATSPAPAAVSTNTSKIPEGGKGADLMSAIQEEGAAPLSRALRWKKIQDWCKEGDANSAISQTALEVTLRYLARNVSDLESAQITDMLKSRGFVQITRETLRRVVDATVIEEQPRLTQETARGGEWNPDKFVLVFLGNLKKRLDSPDAGVGNADDKEEIAVLREKVRELEKGASAGKVRYDKLASEVTRLEQENENLRKKVELNSGGAGQMRLKLDELEGQAATYKERAQEFQARAAKVEHELKDLKQEHSNMAALLQVERKVKKTATENVKKLQEQVAGLQATHSAQNKLLLKKKLGKMTAIMARRKFVRNLQQQNAKIPELEVQNQSLKATVKTLEDQAREYLRLMDSYREIIASRKGDMPVSDSAMPEPMFLRDEAEIDALKAKVASLEQEIARLKAELEDSLTKLEVERQLREQAEQRVKFLEAELARLKEELAQLKDALAKEKKEREEEVALLRARIKELEDEVERLRKALEEEIERRKALERRLAELESDMERRKRIAELEEEVKRLKEELDKERAKREALEKELDRVRKLLEDALKRIAELEAILRDHECEVVTIIEEKVHVEAVIPDMSAVAVSETAKAKQAALKLSPEKQMEITAYATCFNNTLHGDPDLAHLLPINVETPELLFKISDGLLIAKFINSAVPDTIDERALNISRDGTPLTNEQILQNLNLCIGAAKSIGVVLHGDHSSLQMQLMECSDPDVSIDFLYELIKTKYFQQVSVRKHPELLDIASQPPTGLSSLKLKDVEPKEMKSWGPEKLLMRWLNWHRIAGATGQLDGGLLESWGDHLKDCSTYSAVLSRIVERKIQSGEQVVDMPERDIRTDGKRAQFVLDKAGRLGVHHFHRPPFLTTGSERLNLLFSAVLFNYHTGMGEDDEMTSGVKGEAAKQLEEMGQGLDSDSREERAFRMWINSCGIPGVFLHNLFLDCRDGLALLKVIDYVEPGSVDWKKVEMNPNNKFKCLTNCNYAVTVAKSLPGLSIVAIGGTDIANGNNQLVLAIVWQLLRYHTIKQLVRMQQAAGNKGAQLTDESILQWANAKVKSKQHEANPMTEMKSFRDSRLSDSLFFFNLLWVIEPKLVDWKLVTKGESDLEKIRNAGYAIALARKLGAEIFLLPQDIVEVKPNMILLFVGSLMAIRG